MPNAYSNLILRYGDKFITVDIPPKTGKPGECIFPGGTVDQKGSNEPPDPSMKHAALREFDEETTPFDSHVKNDPRNNPNGTSFKDLLTSKGLSFVDMEDHMKLVGAMDNTAQMRNFNAGLHAYYELDLSTVPEFKPPKFSEQDFITFANQLVPRDDLGPPQYHHGGRDGKIVVRDRNQLELLSGTRADPVTGKKADEFKGGAREAVKTVLNPSIGPKITTYSPASPKMVTTMDAQWEQKSEIRLNLAPKNQYQPTLPQTAPYIPSTPKQPTKESACEYVLRQLNSRYSSGCAEVKVVEDPKVKSQTVVKLAFNTPLEAAAFKAKYPKELSTAPMSSDGTTIILGPIRAKNLLVNKLGLAKYGRSNAVPLLTALDQEMIIPTSKWQKLKIEADSEPTKDSGYKPVSVGAIGLEEVEKHLKKGEVPLAIDKGTMIDKYIQSDDSAKKNQAADLLAIYAVKQVMGNLHIPVQINMVDNNRVKVPGHDNHAMKVTFATQEEALDFSKKLFNEYGIHSLTFGPGTMKTPQNGSIFLTKDDLEKISVATKITREPGSGVHAYAAKADAFVQRKLDVQKDIDDTEVASKSHPSL